MVFSIAETLYQNKCIGPRTEESKRSLAASRRW